MIVTVLISYQQHVWCSGNTEMKHYIRLAPVIDAKEGDLRPVPLFQCVYYWFLEGAVAAAVDIEIQECGFAVPEAVIDLCVDGVLGCRAAVEGNPHSHY